MLSKLSAASELVGLVLIAVAIGALAGVWWGIAAAGVFFVLLGVALGRPAVAVPQPGDG